MWDRTAPTNTRLNQDLRGVESRQDWTPSWHFIGVNSLKSSKTVGELKQIETWCFFEIGAILIDSSPPKVLLDRRLVELDAQVQALQDWMWQPMEIPSENLRKDKRVPDHRNRSSRVEN